MAANANSNKNRFTLIGIVIAIVCIIAAICIVFIARFVSEAQQNEVIVRDNVTVYEMDASPFQITQSTIGSFISTSADGLEEGMVVVAGVTEATPNGLLVKVTGIEQVEGGYKVTTEQAALDEVFEKCNVEAKIDFTNEGNYDISQSGGGNNPSYIEKAWADEHYNEFLRKQLGFIEVWAGNSFDVGLNISPNRNVDFWLVDNFSAGFESIDGVLDFSDKIPTPDLPKFAPITIWVGPVPVVLSIDLSLEPSGNLKVDNTLFNTGASIDRKMGFGYKSWEGLYRINEDNSRAPYFEISPDAGIIRVQCDAGITLELSCKLYGLAGPTFDAGLESETKLGLKQADLVTSSNTQPFSVPGIEGEFDGYLKEKVTLPLSGQFTVNVPNINIFSSEDHITLIDAELFNTGDSIVLFEETLGNEYALVNSFTTPALHGYTSGSDGIPDLNKPMYDMPSFTINYPIDWELTSSFDKADETHAYGNVEIKGPEVDGKPIRVEFLVKIGPSGGAWGNDMVTKNIASSQMGADWFVGFITNPDYDWLKGEGFIQLRHQGEMGESNYLNNGVGCIYATIELGDDLTVPENLLENEVVKAAIDVVSSIRMAG